MKQYIEVDPGVIQDGNKSFLTGDPNNTDYARMLTEVEDGEAEVIAYVEPDPRDRYVDLRRDAYGEIRVQLDMMYNDSVNDTTTWVDHVAAVKAAHPK
jgi:hypothetical protein